MKGGGGVGGGGDEQELKLKKWSCQGHFGNSVVFLKLVKLRRDVAERDIKKFALKHYFLLCKLIW